MTSPANHDLVLVGGGHSHALALRMLAMNPVPGVRLTLVSPDALSAYSGMLPGLIAGHYRLDDTHVDLYRLCQATGARFLQASVTRINRSDRSLTLSDGSLLQYDWLSLDVGATPDLQAVDGGHPAIVPVKPVADFYHRWQQWLHDDQDNGQRFVTTAARLCQACLTPLTRSSTPPRTRRSRRAAATSP